MSLWKRLAQLWTQNIKCSVQKYTIWNTLDVFDNVQQGFIGRVPPFKKKKKKIRSQVFLGFVVGSRVCDKWTLIPTLAQSHQQWQHHHTSCASLFLSFLVVTDLLNAGVNWLAWLECFKLKCLALWGRPVANVIGCTCDESKHPPWKKEEESIALATNLRRYLDMDTHRRKEKMESVMAEFRLAVPVWK